MTMRIFTICLAFLLLFKASAQTPTNVVISQVYSGGGVTGSLYRNDFVELYNPTSNPISLAGWSLQYAGATGANWSSNKVDLSGTIGPGRYFLIQLDGGNTGALLPIPDFNSSAIIMSTTSGKVALVSNTNVLNGACPTGSGIVDFVGYGNANCFEGTDGAPTLSTITAAHRQSNGCTDNNDNKIDFTEQGPSPRNSASPAHTCGRALTITNVSPQPFCVNATTGTTGSIMFTSGVALSGTVRAFLTNVDGSYSLGAEVGTAVVNGTSGSVNISIPVNTAMGTGYYVRLYSESAQAYSNQVNVEVINGAKNVGFQQTFPDENEMVVGWTPPSGCFDEYLVVAKEGSAVTGTPSGDGTAYVANAHITGNGTAFGGGKVVYKGTGTQVLVTGLTFNVTYHFAIYTRRGTDWSTGAITSNTTRIIPKPGEILINALSTRYAGTSDEYVELVNTTSKTFNLADLNLSYQNNLGQERVPLGLTGTLAPHSFWLLASGTPVTVGLTNSLARDGGRGTAFADNAYIGLTRKKDNLKVDAVGFGSVSGGTLVEGSPAPAIPVSGGGLRRKTDGVDTDKNNDDFEVITPAAIDLRNSQSRLANSNAVIGGGSYLRMYVTGNAQLSGNVTLSEKLILQNGKLVLGANNLSLDQVEGGSAGTYMQTNGTGKVILRNASGGPLDIPVGNATYNPMRIQNGGGFNWQIGVLDQVLAQGAGGAVQRTWLVEPSATPAQSPTLSFFYNESDPSQLGPLFDKEEKVQVWNNPGSAWQKAGDPQDAGGMAGGMRSATLTNWLQFNSFVVSTAAAAIVLPIRFANLRVFARADNVVLSFTVHNEIDVDHYQVESSFDGVHFENRALILPRNNRGATMQYEFADTRPLIGDRYYRIRGQEQNGAVSFSTVVKVKGAVPPAGFTVAPNPVVGGQLKFTAASLPAGNYQVRILNSLGQVAFQSQIVHPGGWLNSAITLPELKGGWYLLELNGPQTIRRAIQVSR